MKTITNSLHKVPRNDTYLPTMAVHKGDVITRGGIEYYVKKIVGGPLVVSVFTEALLAGGRHDVRFLMKVSG